MFDLILTYISPPFSASQITNLLGKMYRIYSFNKQGKGVSGREKAQHRFKFPFPVNLTSNPSDYIIHSPGLSNNPDTVSFESGDFPGFYLTVNSGLRLQSGSVADKATYVMYHSPLADHYSLELESEPGQTVTFKSESYVGTTFHDGVHVLDYFAQSLFRFEGERRVFIVVFMQNLS